MIRIILADDHQILRDGLRSMLEDEPDMEIVGEAEDGQATVQLARKLQPDVVVMDIGMPGLNGVEATRQITADALCASVKVLCLSLHTERRFVTGMLEAGASGYLVKTGAGRELVAAVHAVTAGQTYLSPEIARDVITHYMNGKGVAATSVYADLTAREREILQLIAEGHHTKMIGDRLGISPKTVLAHRENVMKKLGLDSVAALTRYALREGIAGL